MVSLGTSHSRLSSEMLEESGLVLHPGVFFPVLGCVCSSPECWRNMQWRTWGCQHTQGDPKGETELVAACLAWPGLARDPFPVARMDLLGSPWQKGGGPGPRELAWRPSPTDIMPVAVGKSRVLPAPWVPWGRPGCRPLLSPWFREKEAVKGLLCSRRSLSTRDAEMKFIFLARQEALDVTCSRPLWASSLSCSVSYAALTRLP